MKEKYKCIYNMRLAGYLMQHGFRIRKIEPDRHHEKWDVYLFDWSEELEETIEFYKFKKSKGNKNYGLNNEGNRSKIKC